MLARTAGIIAGLVVFTVYFAIVGANPVLETLFGAALALSGGGLAWRLVGRRGRTKGDGRR